MERSLAWDQDHQHNVPSSSQTKRCHAVPRGIAELKSYDSKRSCRDTKKAPKLRGESGHKKHKAPESMADSVRLKRSAAGRRPETRQAPRRQKTTVGVAAFKQQRLCLQLHRSHQIQNHLNTARYRSTTKSRESKHQQMFSIFKC